MRTGRPHQPDLERVAVAQEAVVHTSLASVGAELVRVGTTLDELGEGPLWLPRQAELWWVDIPGHRMHRWCEPGQRDQPRQRVQPVQPGQGRTNAICTTWGLPRTVGALLPTAGRRLLLATSFGLELFDPDDGSLEPLVAIEDDRQDRRMNDARVDPSGRVYAGTMRRDESSGCDDGVLYRIDADLSLHTILTGLGCPNGIVWPSPHEMVFIDSPRHRLDRFRIDPATGDVLAPLPPIDLAAYPGLPDGMTLDAEGCFWVAFWGGGTVRQLSPDGRLVSTVGVPVLRTTCPTFAGPGLDVLVITSAVDPQAPSSAETLDTTTPAGIPGALFALRTEARGRTGAVWAGPC